MSENTKVKQRQIEGTPNVKLFTIAKFHETRLNKIEKFLAELEQFKNTNGNSSDRVDTLEENLSVAFDSIQSISQKVTEKLRRVDTLESRVARMAAKGSVTTKLAVMGQQLQLLANKVEELEQAAASHDHSSQEDEEKGSDEENEGGDEVEATE
jgi:uncharacterized coiled-coil protein SlyX